MDSITVMMFAAAVLAGVALGALVPSADTASLRGVRIAAFIVLIAATVVAWPIISPDNTWPALAFGLSGTSSVLLMRWWEERVLRRRDAAEQSTAAG